MLVGQPFLAEVTRTTSGKYTNNDITKIIPRRSWSPGIEKTAAEWRSAWASNRDDYGPPDENSSSDTHEDNSSDWDSGPLPDDDIPF